MTATARIEIGENVGISGASICAAVGIAIGDECLFGAGVEVSDTDFHPLKPEGRRSSSDYARIRSAPVVIEKNVFLGSGVRVLKGVRIGRDAVIGAGAVVTSDVPAGGIAVGNPARVIGSVYSVSP
jgi:acetyltransferase-like isoleucine patch superfamily enzyme